MTESFDSDYRALTTGEGIIPLAGWSTLRVAGADRLTFLNNFATNEVKSLAVGGGCETFFCDVKGKILAHGLILVMEDAALIVGVAGTSERLRTHLDRYIIREDVQLADETQDRSWVLLTESGIREVVRLLSGGDAANARPTEWAHILQAADQGWLQTVSCPLTWCDAVLISGRPDAVTKFVEAAEATRCIDEAWSAMRIESGWPLFGVDFDDSNLPQEVDRNERAISFKKGCYLGQETVARIDALGHVNKKLALIKFEAGSPGVVPADLARGAAVFAGENQQAGVLTSVTWSPQFQAPIALAMLRRGSNDLGARITCGGTSGEVVSPIAPTKPATAGSPRPGELGRG